MNNIKKKAHSNIDLKKHENMLLCEYMYSNIDHVLYYQTPVWTEQKVRSGAMLGLVPL